MWRLGGGATSSPRTPFKAHRRMDYCSEGRDYGRTIRNLQCLVVLRLAESTAAIVTVCLPYERLLVGVYSSRSVLASYEKDLREIVWSSRVRVTFHLLRSVCRSVSLAIMRGVRSMVVEPGVGRRGVISGAVFGC